MVTSVELSMNHDTPPNPSAHCDTTDNIFSYPGAKKCFCQCETVCIVIYFHSYLQSFLELCLQRKIFGPRNIWHSDDNSFGLLYKSRDPHPNADRIFGAHALDRKEQIEEYLIHAALCMGSESLFCF